MQTHAPLKSSGSTIQGSSTPVLLDLLEKLIEHYKQRFNITRTQAAGITGARLGEMAKRTSAWSGNYILSILSDTPGKLRPSKAMRMAIPALVEKDLLGSQVGLPSVPCKNQACRQSFIPNHPRRGLCFECSPVRTSTRK